MEKKSNINIYYVLSGLIGLLLIAASVSGIFWKGLYRDADVFLPQLFGQDLITIVFGIPLLLFSLIFSIRGSLRARLMLLGAIGYILYTYATYSFGVMYNELHLLYIVLFSLSLYVLIGLLTTWDASSLKERFKQSTPVTIIGIFFIIMGTILLFMWGSDLISSLIKGKIPEAIITGGIPVNVIYVLDLGVIIPAFILTGGMLLRKKPIAYVLTGALLVKLASLGLAIVAMIFYMSREGQQVDPGQIVFFIAITLIGFIFSVWYLLSLQE